MPRARAATMATRPSCTRHPRHQRASGTAGSRGPRLCWPVSAPPLASATYGGALLTLLQHGGKLHNATLPLSAPGAAQLCSVAPQSKANSMCCCTRLQCALCCFTRTNPRAFLCATGHTCSGPLSAVTCYAGFHTLHSSMVVELSGYRMCVLSPHCFLRQHQRAVALLLCNPSLSSAARLQVQPSIHGLLHRNRVHARAVATPRA